MRIVNMQTGRSMIEMLGVLAIIGILTVGGFNLVMKAQTHQRMNEITDNLTTLARKVRVLARDNEGAAGSFSSAVNTGKAFPDSLEYNATKTTFTDRNDVIYDIYYAGEGAAILFVIGVSGLNTEMCMNMVNGNYGNRATSGFVGMSIGDATIVAALDAIKAGTAANVAIPPNVITLDKAAGLCGENTSMYFAFR